MTTIADNILGDPLMASSVQSQIQGHNNIQNSLLSIFANLHTFF